MNSAEYDVAIAIRCIIKGAVVMLPKTGEFLKVGECEPTQSMYAPDNIRVRNAETGEARLLSEDTLVLTRRTRRETQRSHT